MRPDPTRNLRPRDRRRSIAAVALILAFGALALGPYLAWLRLPSLFDDDLTRVGGFRRFAFPAALSRPFNEHLAPLFELVGWIAWWGSGRRVEAVAGGFLVASYLAWGATLVALAAVVRIETGSGLASLAAVGCFAPAAVAAETVLWYSASSFQWAAAATLAAWYAATRAIRSPADSRRRRWAWLGGAAGFAAAGPMCSAIGILAGPLAALRGMAAGEPLGPRRTRWGLAAVPLGGTVAFAGLLALNPQHGTAVSASVRRNLDPGAALEALVLAPGGVLVPSLLGLPGTSAGLPDPAAALLTVGLLGGVGAWAWRSPRDRGLVVVGLGWVVGGYLLAYGARAVAGDRFILEVGRYHLFPLVGVACWAGAGLRRALAALGSSRPGAGLVAVVALAGLGYAMQAPRIDEAARRSFRFPAQGRAIAAALRLEAACRSERVPLAQAIRIIDPTEPRWFPRPLPFNPLLYLFGAGPTAARQGDAAARVAVLARLSPDDREAIFGGLDAAPYCRDAGLPAGDRVELEPSSHGEAANTGEARLAYVEYDVPPGIVALDVAGLMPGTPVEVWWAGRDDRWTPNRSVRRTTGNPDRPIRLADLPHWRADFARRVRLVRRGRPLPASERPTLVLWTRPD